MPDVVTSTGDFVQNNLSSQCCSPGVPMQHFHPWLSVHILTSSVNIMSHDRAETVTEIIAIIL